MINLRTFLRQSVVNYIKPSTSSLTFSTASVSSSSSSSDDEKKSKSSLKESNNDTSNKSNVDDGKKNESLHKKNSEEALKKLNLLLTQMTQKEPTSSQLKSKLELAKPVDRRKRTLQSEPKINTNINPVKQMLNAVKDVAKVVDGDAKQTEAELLQKLLYPIKTETATMPSNHLSDIVKDMKIDKDTIPLEAVSRAQQVRQILKAVKTPKATTQTAAKLKHLKGHPMTDIHREDQIIEERVNLFGEEGLGIFPPVAEVNTWPTQNLNKTWNTLEERELRLAVIHPPANYFQQMIQWTEQGKIWRFPIDNEQDMDAEKSIYFTEHVFLEKHLEPWCPPKGPIRHFMELVLVGLSKNHYISLEDKKEHIEWFKNYFNEKKALLKEIEAIPADFEFITDNSNKIDAS